MDDDAHRWQSELEAHGSVVFPVDRRRGLVVLVGALVFTAVGVALIARGSILSVVIGVVSVAFFGVLGVPVLVSRLITGRPIVRVDHAGVVSGAQQAAWGEVAGVAVWSRGRSRRARIVVLRLRPGARRVTPGLNLVQRVAQPANDRLVGGPAMFLAAGNGFEPEAMAAWLHQVWSAHEH